MEICFIVFLLIQITSNSLNKSKNYFKIILFLIFNELQNQFDKRNCLVVFLFIIELKFFFGKCIYKENQLNISL